MSARLIDHSPVLAAMWGSENPPIDSILVNDTNDYWWLGDCGHQWTRKIRDAINRGNGCPYCSGRRVLAGFNDFLTSHPELKIEWSSQNSISPLNEGRGSRAEAIWEGRCGHTWKAKIADRVRGRGCPYCAGKKVLPGFNDLATTHPRLVNEWNDSALSPKEVSAGSHKVVYWKGICGHIWDAPISKRVDGQGCPICAGKRVQLGENDLFSQFPELKEQWNFEKNSDINPASLTAGSDLNVWWICEEGHEWNSFVHNRTGNKKQGCPVCSGRTVKSGFNDIASQNPELVRIWNFDKNADLTPDLVGRGYGSVWWKCESGHEWQAPVYKMTKKSLIYDGCFQCASKAQCSLAEQQINDYLESLSIDFVRHDRKIIKPYEIDFLVPSLNIAFEFNGVYWHSEKGGADKEYHNKKYSLLEQKGIQLIQIWEDDWNTKPDLIKRMIAHKMRLGNSRKINARQTSLVSLSREEIRAFMNEFHIQGFVSGTRYTGLKDKDGTLVAAMIFNQQKDVSYLARYATSDTVRGGFTKLLKDAKSFYETTTVKELVTFANLEVSDGSLYENSGWTLDRVLPPDYSYLYKGKREHKFGFRKNRFKNDTSFEYREGLSEKELASLNGLSRVWDSGKKRYTMQISRDI